MQQETPQQQIQFKLSPSKLGGKKWNIKNGKTSIDFGQAGGFDYTLHDEAEADERRMLYIQRHEKIEKQYWNPEGILTKSFWSRFLLWESRDIIDAIQLIEQMAPITVVYTKNTIIRHQKKLKKLAQQQQ